MKLWKIVLFLINVITTKSKIVCDYNITDILCRSETIRDNTLRRGIVSDKSEIMSINMQWCHIAHIDVDAFKNNRKVEKIDLAKNNLRTLQVGVFHGMPTLVHLKLAQNMLTRLPSGVFDDLPSLRILDLRYNNIVYFPTAIFSRLPSLLHLFISNNNYLGRNLNTLLFVYNRNLKLLDFSRNDMTETVGNILKNLDSLEVLELVSCSLDEVPKFATNAKSIEELKLNSNKIVSMDDSTFAGMVNLRSLDLSINSIERIGVNVLTPLKKISHLDLSYNRMKIMPDFRTVPSLQSLDLSHNSIELVPEDSFLIKSELKELNLVGNRIFYLNSNFFSNLRNSGCFLTKFMFDDNPIKCLCLLDILKELKMFRIEYNSEMYDGYHAVCDMNSESTCVREIVRLSLLDSLNPISFTEVQEDNSKPLIDFSDK